MSFGAAGPAGTDNDTLFGRPSANYVFMSRWLYNYRLFLAEFSWVSLGFALPTRPKAKRAAVWATE